MSEKWNIGDKIGGFYEIREIHGGEGKSGMGEVFICYYRWHQKLYALKTYQDRFINSGALRDAFYKEALIWMGLESHPNIIQAHWVHKLDGKIYVVMEYISADNSGRVSLTHHLNAGKPLPFLRTLIWAIQFCYGMEYAHSRGLIVHRDIKPDNILITLDKTLKITDYGLVKAFDVEDSFKGITVGTPVWMSPEQFDDAGSCTVRSDIYSFGVVLYQMAAGHLPFRGIPSRGPHFFEALQRLHKTSPIIRLDSDLFPVIEKCMAKKQGDRYTNFEDLRHALEEIWIDKTDMPLPKPLEFKQASAKDINQKGVAMKHLGKPNEALEFHDRAIEIEPTFANAWNDKGIALWELGRLEETMDCFNKAIELDPEFVHPRCNKAALLLQLCQGMERWASLRQEREVFDIYDHALIIDPEFINLWVGKGNLHFEKARCGFHKDYHDSPCYHFRNAIECYDNVLRINKRSISAKNLKELSNNALLSLKLQCGENCSFWTACNSASDP